MSIRARHRFYTIWAAGGVSLLLALVLTLSLCVNAIAEPAGRSNEPAQGTEQAQEPEQMQEPEQAQEPALMQSPSSDGEIRYVQG